MSGDIVERLRYQAWLNPSEGETADAHYLAADALAEIERLRAVLDVVDAQVAAYMTESIGSSQAIQTISRLLDPEEARRG